MDMKNQQTLTLSSKISATKIVPNPSYAKIPFFLPLSHFGDSTANQFAVKSQRSLRRVSVESPFAEDWQCFATLRRLHCELFTVESQSKLPKCESGITVLISERKDKLVLVVKI